MIWFITAFCAARQMPSVLLVVAAVLPWASAQSVCQTGWTQAPNSSDWGSKCYRELGPPERDPEAIITAGGYNYSSCSVACKAESGTARMLCLASDAEAHFVTKQAYMKGWVGYAQNASRSDYAEPAGGWGWECGSAYTPAWSGSIHGDGPTGEESAQPDDAGEFGEDVSCGFLTKDGLEDLSCLEGDGILSVWSRRVLLNPTPRIPSPKH